ncbi:MAG: division/cell wall cluster transcriptional repressor MraZ [Candidatus Zixiibacteriota bacterium]
MSGFLGQYQTTMDEKGRCALPAKLRSVMGPDKKRLLEGTLILCKGLEGCLSLYPEKEWSQVQVRLATLNFTQRDFRFFSRRLYASACPVSPDRNGRILIPAHLIAEAKLERELLVIGVNRWVEIWDARRYGYYLEQYSGSYEDVAERLFSGQSGAGDLNEPPAGTG